MKKLRNWTLGLALVSLAATGTTASAEKGFSKEVEQILLNKLALVKQIAGNPIVLKTVQEANVKNQDLSLEDIMKKDDKWRKTEGVDDVIKSYMANECAGYLVDFQEANSGFPEIFVTDTKGLIVATTNKTSDFYQADEDWWVKAYDEGRGRSYWGDIEYDESSMAESIALYVPVTDSTTQKTIGVIKAICDITAIKLEL